MTAPTTAPVTTTVLDTALDLLAAGFSVIPVKTDGSKSPALTSWKQYTTEQPDEDTVRAWFAGDKHGLGVVTGYGGLEMYELEGRAADSLLDLKQLAADSGLGELWERFILGWLEASPSGGFHFHGVITDGDVPGNTKLARRPSTPDELAAAPGARIQVLAETRGTGGMVVVAPTPGIAHPSGRPWVRLVGGPREAARLTSDEAAAIRTLLRTLDEMPAPAPATVPGQGPRPSSGGITPLDDFEARTTWDEILTPHGWVHVSTVGRTRYWRRPGKNVGVSATTGRDPERDRLYVFTSSTEFEQDVPYTKPGALAVLEFGGDHRATARELRARGYGESAPRDEVDDPESLDGLIAPTPALSTVAEAMSRDDAHAVFSRWLGEDYDRQALDVVLATAAVERLDGDPLWTLLLSGSGNAKTETVQALTGAGALLTSTISSLGALLSATSRKERAKDATGGLLRQLEPRGMLVIKDVTSILSMSRDARAEVLGALREVYDGAWDRNVGTDGGRTLSWRGRVGLVGAVTTAWDTARDVIAAMGDRFVIVRMDSTKGRQAAGRRAIGNTGSEVVMRAELAAAAGGVLAGMNPVPIDLTDDERDQLLAAADVVTLARTGVEYDYQGNVIDAHAPEMPTRFAKQLAQVVRGAVSIGVPRDDALRLAIRCARDSMPPLRLAILDDVAAHPASRVGDVRRRINKPRNTVDRQLQALHMLEVLHLDEFEETWGTGKRQAWLYSVAEGIDPTALDPQNSSRNGVTHP